MPASTYTRGVQPSRAWWPITFLPEARPPEQKIALKLQKTFLHHEKERESHVTIQTVQLVRVSAYFVKKRCYTPALLWFTLAPLPDILFQQHDRKPRTADLQCARMPQTSAPADVQGKTNARWRSQPFTEVARRVPRRSQTMSEKSHIGYEKSKFLNDLKIEILKYNSYLGIVIYARLALAEKTTFAMAGKNIVVHRFLLSPWLRRDKKMGKQRCE